MTSEVILENILETITLINIVNHPKNIPTTGEPINETAIITPINKFALIPPNNLTNLSDSLDKIAVDKYNIAAKIPNCSGENPKPIARASFNTSQQITINIPMLNILKISSRKLLRPKS